MIFVLKWESIKKVNSSSLETACETWKWRWMLCSRVFLHHFSRCGGPEQHDACNMFLYEFWIFQCLSKNFAVDSGGTVIQLLWSVVLRGCNVVVYTRWSLQKNWRLFEYVLCDCRPLKAMKEWTSKVSFNPRKWITQRTMA